MYRSALTITAAFAIWTTAAGAQSATSDAIIEQYQGLGFDFIEIKEGPTQTKVEAIMPDGRKFEVIYDASGRILKQEIERAEADELLLAGVEVSSEDEDFLDDDDDDDDDYDDDDDDDDDDN